MNNSFNHLLNKLESYCPADGGGSGRRCPADGGGSGRGRSPSDAGGSGR